MNLGHIFYIAIKESKHFIICLHFSSMEFEIPQKLHTEISELSYHSQVKKLDSHLPVRVFSNFMHPVVVVKKLCVPGLMLVFPLMTMSPIYVRLASFKCMILGWSDSI